MKLDNAPDPENIGISHYELTEADIVKATIPDQTPCMMQGGFSMPIYQQCHCG